MELDTESITSGRCLVGKQHWLGLNQTTACSKRTKDDNKTAIPCYLKVQQGPKTGHRKRMHQI